MSRPSARPSRRSRVPVVAGVLSVLAWAAAGCATPCCPPTPDPGDEGTRPEAAEPVTLVLHGGRIYTGDPERPDGPWAEAVAVAGERVRAVGGSAEVLAQAGPETRVLDLAGRLVIPGLNDAHVHVDVSRPAAALGLGQDPLLDEVLDSVRAAAAREEPGTWLRGTIGPSVLDDSRVDRALLDRAAPEHPVYLSGWTGHGRWASTAALRELGVGEREPDGFGGWFERRDGSDLVTGVVHGYDAFRFDVALSRPVDSVAVATFRERAAEAAGFGITSVQQMALPFLAGPSVEALRRADVPVRWRVIHMPVERSALDDPTGGLAPDPRVRVDGVKWVADGTPAERLMRVRRPYGDRPGWTGRFYLGPATLERAVRAIEEAGEQLLVHASGDAAIETLFDVLESVAPAAEWPPRRVRIEHGDLLLPDLVDRARALGVVVVQNPSHLTGVEMQDRRFDGTRRERLQPLRSLVEAGIPLALGSDGPLNPFLNLMFAVVHPVNPEEALTVEQALAAYTRGSAYAEFQEHEKGILRPGLWADLAVLSQDVFEVPPEALPATRSLLTVVGGRIVHRDGL